MHKQFIVTCCLAFVIACLISIAQAGNPSSSLVRDGDAGLASRPLEAISRFTGAKDVSPLFETIPASRSGIKFLPDQKESYERESRMNFYAAPNGVAIGDYDSDGRPDVFVTNNYDGGHLYRNVGGFRFEDVSKQAGFATDEFWSTGVSFADVDNDGDLDLYLCGFGCANRLYLNQGNGSFTERAKDFGLDYSGASNIMSFADVDRDGDLDGYLLTNSLQNNGAKIKGEGEFVDGKVILDPKYDELLYVMYLPDGSFKLKGGAEFDHFYRNENGKGFTDISKEVGIHGPNHHGLSATWWDYDGDQWPDLWVSNDFYGPDHLYHHNGDSEHPAFTNEVRNIVPHVPWYSMGSDHGDINNDGFLDLMSADMAPSSHYRSKLTMGDMTPDNWFLDFADPPQYMRNMLLVNTGRGSFLESAQMSGIAQTDWTWSVRMEDYDCDGLVDVHLTTGMTRDFMNTDLSNQLARLKENKSPEEQSRIESNFWKDKPVMVQANAAFKNMGDLKFESKAEDWGLNEVGVSFGAATGDLDGDGDLDLVVNNFARVPTVYRNHAGSKDPAGANRVSIKLKGLTSNSHGVGAMVRIESSSGSQVRYLSLARGYLSSSEPALFFGLGADDKIDRLTIQWPSGHEQEFANLAVNRAYAITEPEGPADLTPQKSTSEKRPLLAELKAFENIRHKEKRFDDFELQPLLPSRLSQLGPGMAWGDLNGDGKEDFVLGGAAGDSVQIYLRKKSGFTPLGLGEEDGPEADRECEDMATLMLDADGDGDLDLYVSSGGVEAERDSPRLRDRLYLNDGDGRLRLAADALPDVRDSSGVAVAADYDRDGDLDIFVGGRLVRGEYPTTPRSRLLRNDSKAGSDVRFADVTTSDADGLSETGMVTGAIWSDTNNDGWIDLVVTHEWGPVKVFRNRNGKLVDETREAGLADRLGWYNGISGGDVDHDGDIDLVVTNFGRNTKYHPKKDAPIYIYHGDFENTGSKNIVEAAKKKEGLLPVRGKSCSQNAMPGLKKKFPTYDSFASKLLSDIYTPTCLNDALELVANDLDSGVLINQGNGRFEFQPLPTLAQISPGFGVELVDLNFDGNLDIVMAQNFFGPQRETGRMDGGVGVVLLGDGSGAFDDLWPNLGGFEVRGDATALTLSDLNGDRAPDVFVAVNDGSLRGFLSRQSKETSKHVVVQLSGSPGNPNGIGSRVVLKLDDGSTHVEEIYAGSGYLSQSSSKATFCLMADRTVEEIEIRWPDGRTSKESTGGKSFIELQQPNP